MMVHTEYQEGVALIKLDRGITNALNQEILNELLESLEIVKKDSKVRSIVLSSSNDKFFCIGYDVKELYTASREEFSIFFKTFNKVCMNLYTLPKPTVAAITGHAIAGGCALALCCDYRFIAEGRKLMGFNVLKLGLPVPYLINCILQRTVGTLITRDIADTGELYPPEQLLKMGMVDHVLPLTDIVPYSLEKAQRLGALPQKSYAITKRDRVEWIEIQVLEQLAEKELFFVECFFSDEARSLFKEAMEKF
ncbi:MAG: enoyl-CoA hydratase/isomerase family protein [Theionarchaea archaeon]|nr:enoyl-CoA hydratase/isomerase family protein [Theionarchaea archaeon]